MELAFGPRSSGSAGTRTYAPRPRAPANVRDRERSDPDPRAFRPYGLVGLQRTQNDPPVEEGGRVLDHETVLRAQRYQELSDLREAGLVSQAHLPRPRWQTAQRAPRAPLPEGHPNLLRVPIVRAAVAPAPVVGVPYRGEHTHFVYDRRGVEFAGAAAQSLPPTDDIKKVEAIVNQNRKRPKNDQLRIPPVNRSPRETVEGHEPELQGVHGLFIPGVDTANDTEVPGRGVSRAVTEQHRPTGANIVEHESRSAYERRCLSEARNRGLPILGVCGGSWRVLQAYGGGTETLSPELQGAHNPSGDAKWEQVHPLDVVAGSALANAMTDPPPPGPARRSPSVSSSSSSGRAAASSSATSSPVPLVEQPRRWPDPLPRHPAAPAPDSRMMVNSTHWAVAAHREAGEQVGDRTLTRPSLLRASGSSEDPDRMLGISAYAPSYRGAPRTVEGFESRYGAPVIGVQFHPEAYLRSIDRRQDMPGRQAADPAAAGAAQRLFAQFRQSAMTAQRRMALVREAEQRVGARPEHLSTPEVETHIQGYAAGKERERRAREASQSSSAAKK